LNVFLNIVVQYTLYSIPFQVHHNQAILQSQTIFHASLYHVVCTSYSTLLQDLSIVSNKICIVYWCLSHIQVLCSSLWNTHVMA